MPESNPLLETHELPPFEAIETAHILPAIKTILAECRKMIKAVEQAQNPDWRNTVAELEAMQDRLSQAWSPVGHLHGVQDSEPLREAYNACLPLLSEFSTEMGQNATLFAAYRAIRDGDEYATLDPAQKKVIDNTLRDFRLSGIDLPAEQQGRFAAIRMRLSELSSRFSENVLDATQAWTKQVTDVSELAGLPESALGAAAQNAASKNLEGYLLTLTSRFTCPCSNIATTAPCARRCTPHTSPGRLTRGPMPANSTILT